MVVVGDSPSPVREAEPPPPPPSVSQTFPACPYAELADDFVEFFPRGCKPDPTYPKLQRLLERRWRDRPGPDREKWRRLFAYARASPFRNGRKPGTKGRDPFRLRLEWILEDDNFAKVLSGFYEPEAAHG